RRERSPHRVGRSVEPSGAHALARSPPEVARNNRGIRVDLGPRKRDRTTRAPARRYDPGGADLRTYRKRTGRRRSATFLRPGHTCARSEEHTSELQSRFDLVCRLLLEKKNNKNRRP